MASHAAGDHDSKVRVRVVARTKPTANFPHDIIDIDEDGKVRHTAHPEWGFPAYPPPKFTEWNAHHLHKTNPSINFCLASYRPVKLLDLVGYIAPQSERLGQCAVMVRARAREETGIEVLWFSYDPN